MTWDRILNLPKETNGHDFHFWLEIDFNMIKKLRFFGTKFHFIYHGHIHVKIKG